MHINSSSAQIKANESGHGPCDSQAVSANSARSRIRSCSFHIYSCWVNSSFQTYAVSDQVAGWLHTNNKPSCNAVEVEEAPKLNLRTCCSYCLHTQTWTESARHAILWPQSSAISTPLARASSNSTCKSSPLRSAMRRSSDAVSVRAPA